MIESEKIDGNRHVVGIAFVPNLSLSHYKMMVLILLRASENGKTMVYASTPMVKPRKSMVTPENNGKTMIETE